MIFKTKSLPAKYAKSAKRDKPPVKLPDLKWSEKIKGCIPRGFSPYESFYPVPRRPWIGLHSD